MIHHNPKSKHRRTVSSIIVGQNQSALQKETISTFQDTQDNIITEIPTLDFCLDKTKTHNRQRAVSDLIQASNKIQNSKSIFIEELNISVNYKDPSFNFGRSKNTQGFSQIKNMFKKKQCKKLDDIAEKPKTSRLFLRKKTFQIEDKSQKNSLVLRKPVTTSVVSSLNKASSISTNNTKQIIRPVSEKQTKKQPTSLKKDVKKLQIKRNFKF